MKQIIITLLILFALIFHCTGGQRGNNSMASYYYLDGSANIYTVTSSTIVYGPVKPGESSTGMYSGGDPYKVNISKDQYDFLKSVFKKSINNKSGQTDLRGKGTGMIIVLPKNKSFIFEMNSAQKKEIEEALQKVTEK